jgi:hypothetical protein
MPFDKAYFFMSVKFCFPIVIGTAGAAIKIASLFHTRRRRGADDFFVTFWSQKVTKNDARLPSGQVSKLP